MFVSLKNNKQKQRTSEIYVLNEYNLYKQLEYKATLYI